MCPSGHQAVFGRGRLTPEHPAAVKELSFPLRWMNIVPKQRLIDPVIVFLPSRPRRR
jgi:hypothetical protein